MRRILIAVAALSVLAAASRDTRAQQPAPVSGAASPADSVTRALGALSLSREGIELNGRFSNGDILVEKGDSVAGAVVTVGGNADIRGYVAGGVYALWGDVTVHPGAEVLGGATAYHGRVIIDGGQVRGDLHAWPAAARADATAVAPLTTGGALRLAAAWTGMLLIVGLLVLVIAFSNLEATARALEQDFGRAFFIGVMGQLGFLPLVLLAVVALAVTIVGALLVPFLLVAAPIAFAGFVTLGWLALALVTGRALLRSQAAGTRAEAVRALVLGTLLLMVPWLLAAALQSAGTVAIVVRIIAVATTWVAATAGLGATLTSRAGSKREKRDGKPQQPLQGGWATPTPISGVAAARRPIPARPGATPQ